MLGNEVEGSLAGKFSSPVGNAIRCSGKRRGPACSSQVRLERTHLHMQVGPALLDRRRRGDGRRLLQ